MDTLGTYLFHFITGSAGILLFFNFLYGLGHIGIKYFEFLKTSKSNSNIVEYFDTVLKGFLILCIIAFILLVLLIIVNLREKITEWI